MCLPTNIFIKNHIVKVQSQYCYFVYHIVLIKSNLIYITCAYADKGILFTVQIEPICQYAELSKLLEKDYES